MPDVTDSTSSPTTKAAPAKPTGRMSIAGRAGTAGGRAGRGARSMPWVRRWVRNNLTRDQLASGLRSLLWVAPLTVLIWIYAEREQVTETKSPVSIPIEVVSTDPQRIVTITRPADHQVSAYLYGPNASVEAVREKLLDTRNFPPVRIEVGRNVPLGDQRIAGFASRLGDDPRLVSAGVTLTKLMPESIDVAIDQIGRKEVPVKPEAGFERYGRATFEPAVVTVSGPEGELRDAGDSLVAYAQLINRPELTSEQSTVTIKNVSVKLAVPKNSHIVLQGRPAVSATIQLTRKEQYKIEAVILWPAMPLSRTGRVQVMAEPSLKNVWVQGPKSEIDRLKPDAPNRFLPRAWFEIPTEAQPGGEKVTAHLEYILPPGVKPLRGVSGQPDAPENIEYQLVKPGDS